MDFNKLTREEKIELLNKAKDAYYNSGEELLSDAEYDQLEREVGLENKSYVGSKQGNYDIKHAFIMGSLAKCQIVEKNGEVNWAEACDTINSFLKKANNAHYYETTPKLDGASFSAEFKNVNGKAYLETVATRGNGEYGSDIKHWFKPLLKTEYWSKIDQAVSSICEENSDDILCIRGEVLVPQSVFSSKYTEQYVNPRAFVSGMLGIKYEDASEIKKMQGKDLHFVCYDYRLFSNGKYEELSWMNPHDPTYKKLEPYLNHVGELIDSKYCQVHKYNNNINIDELQDIYEYYDNYRCNISEYALDGIVIKPECAARKYNMDRVRPQDCIAVKFMPMINATTIVDIEWNIRKTGEYFPTGIVDPIIMPDGKKITRASLHNYNYIVKNKVGIGAKVRISLAGDIIPFVYEVVETAETKNNMNLPTDGYVRTDVNSGAMHYMKEFSEYEEQKSKFLSSADVLNINMIGPAAAEDLFDTLNDSIPDLENIIYLMNDKSYKLIYDKLGDGKSVQNIVNNMKQYAAHITLEDIIKSFCFKLCGNKASEVCAKIISGLPYSTNSLPEVAYSWALDKTSRNYFLVTSAMNELDVEMLDKNDVEDEEEKIPVILTGDPSDCTEYDTKAKFMQAHGKLKETTSWKEVKILFTNSLDSNTGKMQKAKKAGIEIRSYDDADEFLTAHSIKEQNSNETALF